MSQLSVCHALRLECVKPMSLIASFHRSLHGEIFVRVPFSFGSAGSSGRVQNALLISSRPTTSRFSRNIEKWSEISIGFLINVLAPVFLHPFGVHFQRIEVSRISLKQPSTSHYYPDQWFSTFLECNTWKHSIGSSNPFAVIWLSDEKQHLLDYTKNKFVIKWKENALVQRLYIKWKQNCTCLN